MEANNFSLFELRLVRSMMENKTDAQIATELERPKAEIAALIKDMTGDKSPAQKQLEKQLQQKDLQLRQRRQQQEAYRQQKQQQQAKKDWENRKSKALKKLVAQQNAEREQQRRRRNEPAFKTKQVDYAKLISVRVDHKTIICIKPGEDPQAAIEKYKENLERKNRTAGVKVPFEKAAPVEKESKKFKPTVIAKVW